VSQGEPKVLGRYEITGETGRGMMGVVYRAVDPVLGRTVALKTVNIRLAAGDEDRASFEARFMAEARAAAQLSHPAIVTVHDFGRDAGTDTLYIALEHLEGRTLAEIVRADGALHWRRALAIGGRIAGALDHAHQRGIIHRDVKPANIMVLASGEPKLMDFGIAKIDAADLTAPGDFLGTPAYMSPEQATGAEIDGRSDVFSLGAVLYLALTGRRAFDAPTVPGVVARVVHEPAGALELPDLPADVESILERCLAKSPASRYARARHLEEDIEDVLAGRPPRHLEGWVEVAAPVLAPGPAAGPAAAATGDVVIRWVDRLGWRGLAAIAACLALIAVGAALMRRPPETSVAAEPAATTPLIPAPARLEVSLRHPFRVGTLRVWVDGALALEETVPGRVTRDLLALKLRRGTFTGVLDVPPGERVVRVQVDDGDGFRESRRIRATFASGQARRLDATVDGMLQKDLALVLGP
jgi:Protein kinase domain